MNFFQFLNTLVLVGIMKVLEQTDSYSMDKISKFLENMNFTINMDNETLSRDCYRTPKCFKVQQCCLDYLETLINSNITDSEDYHLEPFCMPYMENYVNENEVIIKEMVVWMGCNEYINNSYNNFATSIVYDKVRRLYFYDLSTALCNNNYSSSHLIKLPNWRHCSPNHINTIQSLSSLQDAWSYLNDNCTILSPKYLKESPHMVSEEFFIPDGKCDVNETILPPYFPIGVSWDNITLEILCHISKDSLKEGYRNIFCFFYDEKFKEIIPASKNARFSPISDGDAPSLIFLFNPNQNDQAPILNTLSERIKLNQCKSPVEMYYQVEMCEITNCVSQFYLLPPHENICPIINSFGKVINITLTFEGSKNIKDLQTAIDIITTYFKTIKTPAYSNDTYLLNIDNETAIYFSSLPKEKNSLTIIINNTSPQIKELVELMVDKLSLHFNSSIFVSNSLNNIFCPFLNLWSISTLYSHEYNDSKLISSYSCPQIPFHPQHNPECTIIVYRVITESSPLSLLKNQSNSSFIFFNDSIAMRTICPNETRSYKNETISNSFSKVDFWITIILIPLSIIGLVGTIITYSIHRVLRTLPGLMVLAMSSCLLMSYMGFLMITFISSIMIKCEWMAMVTHFALLSCLCWMAIIAVDSARTFASVKITSKREGSLWKAFVYLWIVVCIFVMVFWAPAVINYSCGYTCLNWLPVSYDRVPICWLRGRISILYGIAGPVFATSLVSNVCLITSIFGILRSLQGASKLIKSSHINRDSKIIMIFSIKLSILTGFTIGMMQLSALFDWKISNFVFTAINSSLGILVGILFNCNRRVQRLYFKKKMFYSYTTRQITIKTTT